jgi:hypothetical protein
VIKTPPRGEWLCRACGRLMRQFYDMESMVKNRGLCPCCLAWIDKREAEEIVHVRFGRKSGAALKQLLP